MLAASRSRTACTSSSNVLRIDPARRPRQHRARLTKGDDTTMNDARYSRCGREAAALATGRRARGAAADVALARLRERPRSPTPSRTPSRGATDSDHARDRRRPRLVRRHRRSVVAPAVVTIRVEGKAQVAPTQFDAGSTRTASAASSAIRSSAAAAQPAAPRHAADAAAARRSGPASSSAATATS